VQCHGADTGLIAQCYTVAGMAFPRESMEQHRGVIPRCVKVVARVLWCRSIKCPYTGQERGRRACSCPRVRRSSPEGALGPRARRTLPEGAFNPQARRTSPEGASAVPPWRAAGATRIVIVSCACFRFVG
jgi:hypothetical protein